MSRMYRDDAMRAGLTYYEWVMSDPNTRRRVAASRKVQAAVRRGEIHKPLVCPRCDAIPGDKRMHAHHHDYDKPLEVAWMCLRCHQEEHRRLRREARKRAG